MNVYSFEYAESGLEDLADASLHTAQKITLWYRVQI